MPSPLPVPSIDELVAAFHAAVRARRDKRADGRDGSAYDYIAGVSAIFWSREAQRDADLFRAISFDEAEGDDLTLRARELFKIERELDTYGRGFATLVRSSTTAGEGTVWAGTRVRLAGTSGDRVAYAVERDVAVQPTDRYAVLPLRATRTGPGVAVHDNAFAFVDDTLWDSSWTVQSLLCDDGTLFEPAHEFRARVRALRLAQRVGYEPRIVQACQEAGAAHVALFRSDFGADDHGLNACYVGDAGYSGSADLVRRVTVALEGVRVCGADMPIRPLTTGSLTVRAVVSLWDSPAYFHLADLELTLRSALVTAFAGTSEGFAYQRDALAGALARVTDTIQSVSFVSPSDDTSVLVDGQFPATLMRYALRPADVFLDFIGPS